MMSDSTVASLRQPDEIDDPLTAVLRDGARQPLAQAAETEAEAFLAVMKGVQLPDGRERVVRHGHGPERLVQTGIGLVAVQRVKLRDGRELLVDLKAHGLSVAPELATAVRPKLRSHLGRWRTRLLEGTRRGLPHDPASAVLGAQNLKRPE